MRPLPEKIRYIKARGKFYREGDQWIWQAAPDVVCEVRELRGLSMVQVAELAYDVLKGAGR